MHSSDCWALIWGSASPVRICVDFLLATAIRNCASFWLVKSCSRSRAIFQSWAAWRNQQEESVTNLFPMFLKLEGRQCLVVGAGKVGEPKIGGLLETGARIRVVALDASPAVREWARLGKINLDVRAFTASD